MRRIHTLLLSLLAICMLISPSFAQNFRGGLNGTVTDSQGAFVPNPAVVITDVDTSVTHNLTTSSAGEFSLQDLPLGT